MIFDFKLKDIMMRLDANLNFILRQLMRITSYTKTDYPGLTHHEGYCVFNGRDDPFEGRHMDGRYPEYKFVVNITLNGPNMHNGPTATTLYLSEENSITHKETRIWCANSWNPHMTDVHKVTRTYDSLTHKDVFTESHNAEADWYKISKISYAIVMGDVEHFMSHDS